jgi:hypothetical protein
LDFLNDWNFTYSEKGWTNNRIALIWLKTVFIPLTKPDNPREPRLLILNGHGSYMTEDFLFEYYNNNIFLLFLPIHASHVLQPLDVAVFGPLKHIYRRYISDLTSIADSSQIGKISFLYNYNKARNKAIMKSNAYAGFKATGLWPVNVAKVLINPMVTTTPTPAVTPIPHTNEQYYSPTATPRSSIQLRKALQAIPGHFGKDPTVRLLFRKIGTQLDRQGVIIEEGNREISLLRYQNEEL